MQFRLWLEMESNEELTYLLQPQAGNRTGREKPKKISNDITVYTDPNGSYRFVKLIDMMPVAAVQVMSKDGKNGLVANVFTLPQHRRQGHARQLLDVARQIFQNITFSDDRSNTGDAWVKGVNPKAK